MAKSLLFTILLMSLVATARAAGTFEGKWSAEVEPNGKCNGQLTFYAIVQNSAIVDGGMTHDGKRVASTMAGTINPDGSAHVYIGTKRVEGDLKFSGAAFEGDIYTLNCSVRRHLKGALAN